MKIPDIELTSAESDVYPHADRVQLRAMLFQGDSLERGGKLTRMYLDTTMAPWGGSRGLVDGYEKRLRAVTEAQLAVARALRVEPARAFAASCADLTRDLGATQLSTARWILDV